MKNLILMISVLIAAFTSLYAEPSESIVVHGLGRGTIFKVKKEINIPARHNRIVFREGNPYPTSLNLLLRFVNSEANNAFYQNSCHLSIPSQSPSKPDLENYDRKISAGRSFEVSDVAFEFYSNGYTYENPHVKITTNSVSRLFFGENSEFQLVCFTWGQNNQEIPAFMTLAEMRTHLGDYFDITIPEPTELVIE